MPSFNSSALPEKSDIIQSKDSALPDPLRKDEKCGMKIKENDMEVDEGSKGSSMDVDSLMKDDIMDIELEDNMDVDNDIILNQPVNGLEKINEEYKPAASVLNDDCKVSHESKVNDDPASKSDEDEIIFDKQVIAKNKNVDSKSVLKKIENEDVIVLNSTDIAEPVKNFVIKKSIELVDLDDDLIKFNDTIEEDNHNVIIVPEGNGNKSKPDESKKEEAVGANNTVSSVSLNSSRDDSAACVLTSSEVANFLGADFNGKDSNSSLSDTKASETLKKTIVPVEMEKQVIDVSSDAEGEDGESSTCEGISVEKRVQDESCQNRDSNLIEFYQIAPEPTEKTAHAFEKNLDVEQPSDKVENVISINMNKAPDQNCNEEELLKSHNEDNIELDANEEKILKEDGNSKNQPNSQTEDFRLLTENDQSSLKESDTKSNFQKDLEEAMDVDFEENFDVEMSGPSEHVDQMIKDSNAKDTELADVSDFNPGLDNLFNENSETETAYDGEKQSDLESAAETDKETSKNNSSAIEKTSSSFLENILKSSKSESGDSNREINLVSVIETVIERSLDSKSGEIHEDEEGTETDPFTNIEPGEVISHEIGGSENNDVPFGIISTATIAPNEFENLVSAGDVNEHQFIEENTDLGEPHDNIPTLSDLAMKVVIANKEKETVALEMNKMKKKPIKIQTIKQEKLDFNFEEEGSGQFGGQNDVNVNLPTSKNTQRSKNNNRKLSKREKYKERKKRQRERWLQAKKRKEEGTQDKSNCDAQMKLENTTEEAVENSKKETRKKYSLTTEKILKSLRIEMNDAPKATSETSTSTKRKLTRSSIKVATDYNETSPKRKSTRLSLPESSSVKRTLRSTAEASSKIDLGIIKNEESERKSVAGKKRNVAVKSTTPRVQLKNDLKIVEKKFRNVARKRGQPYFKKQSGLEQEPAPIFVDTNFGSQDIDMFINENDDEEPLNFYNNKNNYKLSLFAKTRMCKVVIKRMAGIERLIPVKKSMEKIEPIICEFCEPKRAFLSKSSLADHIKNEHMNPSSGTSISPIVKSEVRVPSDMNACTVCKKLFHSKNRLAAHMKTCKSDESNIIITKVPGIDLSNLGKNVTISIATPERKNEDEKKEEKNVTLNSMKYVCDVCNRKFLLAAGLRSHKRTHKNSEKSKSSLPKPELDPLRIDSEKPASKPSSTKTNNRSKDLGMKSQRGNVEPEVKPTKPIDCVSILDSPAESKKSGKETRRNKEKVKELSPDIEILEEKLTISSVSSRSQTPTKKKNEKEIEVNISPGKSNNSRKR